MRVYWTDEEKTTIVNNIVRSLQKHRQTPRDLRAYGKLTLKHLRVAQRELHPSRHRDIVSVVAFDWVYAAVQAAYDRAFQAPAVPATPAIMPSVAQATSAAEESLEDLLVKVIRRTSEIFGKISTTNLTSMIGPVAASIATAIMNAPLTAVAVSAEAPKPAPEPAQPAKPAQPASNGHAVKRKPKVMIVGLLGNQERHINQVFSDQYKLYCQKDRINGTLPDADLVITTKFMSHSMTEAIKAKFSDDIVIHTTGGVNQIVSLLRNRLTSLRQKLELSLEVVGAAR